MALLLNKSLDDLMQTAMKRLGSIGNSSGETITTRPGGVARLLLAIISESLEEFYDTLQVSHLMSFLSTATDQGLDLLGGVLNCEREADELDETYKIRLSQQATSLEAANETAVRLATLSIPGVQDTKLTRFTHGTGSFSVFLITEGGVISEEIIGIAKEKIRDVAAYGIRYEVYAPTLVPVSLHFKIIFVANATDQDLIKEQAKEKVQEYINSREISETLIFNEVIESVMGISDDIYDMEVIHYSIKDRPVLNANQDCRWDERFIESSKPDAILVL